MKQTRWLLGAALVAMPVVLALPGCGGGNSGSNIFSPTPTSTPGTPGAQNFSAPVNFGNGQTGRLNLTTQGNATTGTLVVKATGASIGQRSFNFAIPAGTYDISGTFTLPGSFSVNGAFPAPIGAFSITGTIPMTTQTGSFTVNANGETTSGTIPALNTLPTPAPTTPSTNPTPVGTPLPAVGGQLNVTFSNASINASSAPFTGTAIGGAFGSAPGGNFGVDYKAGSVNRTFLVQVLNNFSGSNSADFKVGQQFGFSPSGIGTPGVAEVIYTAVIGVRTGQWSARSGKLTITAVTPTSVSYRLDTVHFAPGLVNVMGTGTFDLNGTGTASK